MVTPQVPAAPARLFKYVGFTSRVLQQLCLGEVYYADPGNFNDPLDCRPRVVPDLPISELKDVLAQLIARRVSKEVSATMRRLRFKAETIATRQQSLAQQTFGALVQNIEYGADHPDVTNADAYIRSSLSDAIEFELRKAYDQGVLCLSAKFDSPLMWSHYADQHRGICIEFDVETLADDSLRKVQYGNSRELVASSIREWLLHDSAAARDEIERACLLTKSVEWGYEVEYRLLGTVGSQTSLAPIRSITFGLKCEPSIQYAIVAALGGTHAPLQFFEIRSPGARFELSREVVDTAEVMAGMPRINIAEEFDVLTDQARETSHDKS